MYYGIVQEVNRNYHKILESDWLSEALISALIGQTNDQLIIVFRVVQFKKPIALEISNILKLLARLLPK